MCLLWFTLQIFIKMYNIRFQSANSIQFWLLLTCLQPHQPKTLVHFLLHHTASSLSAVSLTISHAPKHLFSTIIISFPVPQSIVSFNTIWSCNKPNKRISGQEHTGTAKWLVEIFLSLDKFFGNFVSTGNLFNVHGSLPQFLLTSESL